MNILLTSTGSLEDRHFKSLVDTWRVHHHIVETMPFDRLMGYLKLDTRSQWAAVDAVVCKADTDPEGVAIFTLNQALKFAEDFRALPESCAMKDGRKWKSIPLAVISEQPYYFGYPEQISRLNITLIRPSPYPTQLLSILKEAVDDYIKRVLEDYRDLGLIITFEKDRARLGPALKKKDPGMESAYYYAPADRRNNKRLMTVMRDSDGLRADVELFQQLLDMNVGERQMQRFFEDNPFFLAQARLGIQIPHPSYATKRWSPDFAFTSILGPADSNDIELLELKGPAEKLLNTHKHHPGLRSFVLTPRPQWETVEKPFRRKDWSPWRFRRRLSLMCRPIVQISPTELIYAPAFCEDSFRHVVMESYQGAFENEYFDTASMKRYIGAVNGRRGLAFNKAIADIFTSYGWNVRTELQMTELGAPPLAASGDIDVLAWKQDVVWMCECKELLFARTVGEVSEQLTRFRGATGDELDKHMKRARWARSNLNAITQITGSHKPDIHSPLVTSKTVPMQFIKTLGVEVVSADQIPTLLTG